MSLVKYYGCQIGNTADNRHVTTSCSEIRAEDGTTRLHYILCNGVQYKAKGYMVCVNLTSPKTP